MKLYNYFRSSASYRVRIALNYKEVDFEYIPVHLLNDGGEQHKDDYKIKNPMSQVPTLEVNGSTQISQSMAIFEFLDQLFPDRPLIPKDPVKGAFIRQLCELINSGTQPLNNLHVLQVLKEKFGFTDEQKAEWAAYFHRRGLNAFEKMIESKAGEFCHGDDITAADMFLVPHLFAANRFGVPADEFPLLKKIADNCQGIPEFAQAHPFCQPDTPEELRQE